MFDYNEEAIIDTISRELEILWAAHHAVGLDGYMCLYTLAKQDLWRSKEKGVMFWFAPQDTRKIIKRIIRLYNKGKLPNSPLFLGPVVHQADEEGNLKPLGSGFAWASSLCLGITDLEPDSEERVKHLNALTSPMHRGEDDYNGLKSIAFSNRVLKPSKDGAVEGCYELYNVANVPSERYYPFYMLSGIGYLGKNGMFGQPDFNQIINSASTPPPKDASPKDIVTSLAIDPQILLDASYCWDQYDHHHSLFKRFGVDRENIDTNLRYYRMCGNDFELLDATGAKHVDADTEVSFDFLVEGWIPKGAVIVIGATGGTGKSSLAHNLAVKCSIDYKEGEPPPMWLGSKINPDKCGGICVYFSGEDGPAIVHSRAKIYDPEGRAQRLMFQRTNFGEGVNFDMFMERLHKMPDVPLVVIDPARKYLKGDEENAEIVSDFFEAIEEFAIEKNAACVVVHHLIKNAKPERIVDIYDMLRGSQVFIDRPRVVIGMMRDGPRVIAGLAKNNIPAQMGMVQGERVYNRNADKLELEWIPGIEGVRSDLLTDEELHKIMLKPDDQS